MSFLKWLSRSFGRVREDAKTHLIKTGQLLGFDDEIVNQMKSLGDEACEALFLEGLEHVGGGGVDWRAKSGEVIEVVVPFLESSERDLLKALRPDDLEHPSEVVRHIDGLLCNTIHSIRTLDSFGDFVIVVVVDKAVVVDFDEINKNWLV